MCNTKHIVITGRIGVGKSTFAQRYTDQHPNLTILNLDYDKLGHLVLAQEFGIDTAQKRKEMAREFFADATTRQMFENKLHPAIFALAKVEVERFAEQFKGMQSATHAQTYTQDAQTTQDLVILHQIPLYNKTSELFRQTFGEPTEVITLNASNQEIIERLITSRNMTENEIIARLQAY